MRVFWNWSISRQLSLLVGALIVVIAGFAIRSAQERAALEELSLRAQKSAGFSVALLGLSETVYHAQFDLFQHLKRPGEADLADFRQRARRMQGQLDELAAGLEGRSWDVDPAIVPRLHELRRYLPPIREAWEELAGRPPAAGRRGSGDERLERLIEIHDIFFERTQFSAGIGELAETQNRFARAAFRAFENRSARHERFMHHGTALILVLLAGILALGYRYFIRPLRLLAGIARQVGQEGALGQDDQRELERLEGTEGRNGESRNELVELARNFSAVLRKFLLLSEQASAVAADDLANPVLDTAVEGRLGERFGEMTGFLRSFARRFESVSRGNFTALTAEGALATPFNRMLRQLHEAQRQQRRLSALVESSESFIALSDLDGTIAYLNSYGRRALAGGAGRPGRVWELMEGEAACLQERIVSGVRTQGRWDGEIVFRGAAGAPLAMRVICFGVRPEREDDPLEIAWLGIDITEAKQAAEVTQRYQAIVQAARMTSLGEMAAGIAHEINNPLTVITCRSSQLRELAEAGPLPRETTIKSLQQIEATALRIAKIVKGLRSFAREGEHDPFVSTPLRSIFEDTLELCRARIAAQAIELRVLQPPEDLFVECRAVQLCQVLLNLLGNAHDALAGAPGGWISVAASVTGDHVELSVSDNGPGVPEELRERIMQPFFTTKGPGRGTGLGLSISRGIIEAHGGSLRLDAGSPYTRFVVRLPLRQRQRAAA